MVRQVYISARIETFPCCGLRLRPPSRFNREYRRSFQEHVKAGLGDASQLVATVRWHRATPNSDNPIYLAARQNELRTKACFGAGSRKGSKRLTYRECGRQLVANAG